MFKMFIKKLLLFSCVFLFSFFSMAEWSANVGYHNPPNASAGLNFLYFWSQWAFELGIGALDTTQTQNNTTTVSAAGAMSFKYLMRPGALFRPYGQFGMGTGANVGGTNTANASASNPFVGGGFFLKGSDLYIYASYNIISSTSFSQFGVGLNF